MIDEGVIEKGRVVKIVTKLINMSGHHKKGRFDMMNVEGPSVATSN